MPVQFNDTVSVIPNSFNKWKIFVYHPKDLTLIGQHTNI